MAVQSPGLSWSNMEFAVIYTSCLVSQWAAPAPTDQPMAGVGDAMAAVCHPRISSCWGNHPVALRQLCGGGGAL